MAETLKLYYRFSRVSRKGRGVNHKKVNNCVTFFMSVKTKITEIDGIHLP